MPRIPFETSKSESDNPEVPFLKEYAAKLPQNYVFGERVHPVGRVCTSDKGLLLLTSAFKVFLWKKSHLSKQLTEALDAWVEGTKPLGFLYVLPLGRNGSMELGIDTDIPPLRWKLEETENSYGEPRYSYFQICDKEKMLEAGYGKGAPVANPFLNPQTPSPTTGYGDEYAVPTDEKGKIARSRRR